MQLVTILLNEELILSNPTLVVVEICAVSYMASDNIKEYKSFICLRISSDGGNAKLLPFSL